MVQISHYLNGTGKLIYDINAILLHIQDLLYIIMGKVYYVHMQKKSWVHAYSHTATLL